MTWVSKERAFKERRYYQGGQGSLTQRGACSFFKDVFKHVNSFFSNVNPPSGASRLWAFYILLTFRGRQWYKGKRKSVSGIYYLRSIVTVKPFFFLYKLAEATDLCEIKFPFVDAF